MRIYTYKELRENSTDELLDLLSSYLFLKTDINKIINNDKKNIKCYNKENLMNYEMNIIKIKNELIVRSKNKYSK